MWKHLIARLLILILVPLLIYVSVFYTHLRILTKSGPHDDLMTSAFQASLQVLSLTLPYVALPRDPPAQYCLLPYLVWPCLEIHPHSTVSYLTLCGLA